MTEEPTSERSAAARQPPPREPRHWGNVAAGFSAACALAVSAYTAFLQRQQVKAQVWPILSWSFSATTGETDPDAGDDAGDEVKRPTFSFGLRNDGVGPAMVRAMEVTFDEQPIHRWNDLLAGAAPLLDMPSKSWSAHIALTHSRVIAAGEDTHPFEPYGDEAARALYTGVGRIHVRLCYCSVLNDCWEIQAQGFKDEPEPETVTKCFQPRVPFEQ